MSRRRTEKDLVYFENTYHQGPAEIGNDMTPGAALECVTIDGFPEDDNESGEVVCTVWMTSDRGFITDWHNNGYRMNTSVLELIEDAKKQMEENNPRTGQPCTLMVFPKIEFDNGTAVICKYRGQHTSGVRSTDIQVIVDAVAKSYEASGMTVVSAEAVDENAYDLFTARNDDAGSTVFWSGDNVEVRKNMLEADPDESYAFIEAVKQAWESGCNPKDPDKVRAALDLYGLCPNKSLFRRLFQTMTGTDFPTFLNTCLGENGQTKVREILGTASPDKAE